MAAREHRVSRRVLLGAAWTFPLVRAAPRPIDAARGGAQDKLQPGPSTERWTRAVARFHRAQSVLDAAAHEPDDDFYGDILDAFNRALRRLLRAPAPDLRALSLKIDLAVDHEIAELTGGDRCLAALKADARRLAGRPAIASQSRSTG